jgi:pimeloyl-ACP methyl ester carboxylesterase
LQEVHRPHGIQATVASKPVKVAKPRQSMAEIKATGRAKLKAAQEARAAEEAAQRDADSLWTSTFDCVVDSSMDAAQCSDLMISCGLANNTVLILIPGFSSWFSLTQNHVDRWKQAALTEDPASGQLACTLAFKWPCGHVMWSSDEAHVAAAAAWQEAHENTLSAARSLTLILQKLQGLKCNVVIAAHSLGARVALQALANDLATPRVRGLYLLGSAVDNHSLTGLSGAPGEIDGVWYDNVGAAPAEFPFHRLMNKSDYVALVHSMKDPSLTSLWQAAEYARCGRSAPPALGVTGPIEEELIGDDEDPHIPVWMERVLLLEVTQELGETHDPIAYVLTKGVQRALRASLFPPSDGEGR